MRVRFSDSEQWCSPVKPPRSQNYVKPHDARTRDTLLHENCAEDGLAPTQEPC
jgi:hypothetical protein